MPVMLISSLYQAGRVQGILIRYLVLIIDSVLEEACPGFWQGDLRERDHLEDLGVDGRIILKWISKKQDGVRRLDWFCSDQGQVAGCCEQGNELQGSIQFGEFFDQVKNVYVLKKDFVPYSQLASYFVCVFVSCFYFLGSHRYQHKATQNRSIALQRRVLYNAIRAAESPCLQTAHWEQ